MKHYGDITKINGAEMPIVDIICGGSPCQDLSNAGKRAGLAGERSGLFMEQIRIIKEMRNECIRQLSMRGAAITRGNIRPRYMVWENVYGTFSSNKGEDFRVVLEETAKIADQSATIPRPTDGKWKGAGTIMGDGWSIAWRVHDAQFWGVPQRRKRISLVADFGGSTAPEVLFERRSILGSATQSEESWQGSAGDIGTDIETSSEPGTNEKRGGASVVSKNAQENQGEEKESLSKMSELDHCQRVTTNQSSNGEAIGCDTYNHSVTGEIAATINATSCDSPTHSGPSIIQPMGCDIYNQEITGETAATLTGAVGGTNTSGCKVIDRQTDRQTDRQITLTETFCIGNGQANDAARLDYEVCKSLNCMVDPMKIMQKKM